jgi:hypothetical protein
MPVSNSANKVEVIRAKVKPRTVSPSSGATQLLPTNVRRLGLTITNASSGTLLIDFSSAVSEDNYMVELSPGGYYECPYPCSDEVYGRWRDSSGVTGRAVIREFVEP